MPFAGETNMKRWLVVLIGPSLLPLACSESRPTVDPNEVIYCVTDYDCPVLYRCENGVCVEKDNIIYCNDDADCPDGQWCQDSICVGTGDSDVDTDLDIDLDTDTDADTDTDSDTDCQDNDHDGYGNGPDCIGMDCDDERDYVNPAAEEVCDGIDNDCDAKIDEDLTPPVGTCLSQGVCAGSTGECHNGAWECSYPGTYEAHSETICDGLDNDCDGQIDEGLGDCTCTTGETRPCGTSTGECERGEQYCSNGTWGPCDGIMPRDEFCDGKDNDCDGQTDEELTPPVSSCKDKGVCEGAQVVCLGADGWACSYPADYESGTEKTCDGLDNDCDGLVDEDLVGCDVCEEGTEEPCSTDVGECTAGVRTCTGGAWTDCSGVEPTDEICDGKDNDCDGTVDNHLTDDPPECLESGVCSGTIPTCAGAWSCPYPATYEAGSETSCDGLDNDCDGEIDEGLVQQGGADCELTQGVCADASPRCDSQGQPICGYPETYEADDELSCDGLDNDCDGQTDEDVVPGPDACLEVGVCADHPLPVCIGAEGWDCGYAATYEAGDETTCDDLDNDCDGETDEGLDRDGDGHVDCHDNCPDEANPDQADQNDNGIGDVCEVTCAGAQRVFPGDHIEADTTGQGDDYNGETEIDPWWGDHLGGCVPVSDGWSTYGLGNMNGPDLLYELELTSGQSFRAAASAIGGWDMALYTLTECEDPGGDSCELWSADGAAEEVVEGRALVDFNLLLVVDGYEGAAGPFTLDVEVTDPPEGEVCAAANELTLNETLFSTTNNASNDETGAGCAQSNARGPELFYTWTHPTAGDFVAAAVPTNWDLSLYLFQDCTDVRNSCVGGSDGPGDGGLEHIDYTAEADAVGYLAVDGYAAGDSGGYAVAVFDPAAQTQESCATAEPIGMNEVRIGDTRGASDDHNACKASPGADHVYAFTAQATEQVKIVMAPDTGLDAVLYVFTDCADPGSSCERSADSGSAGQNENLQFTAQAGTTYYIATDGYRATSAGVYAVQVTTP